MEDFELDSEDYLWEDTYDTYEKQKGYLLQLKKEYARTTDLNETYFLKRRISQVEREIDDWERFHRETEERMRKQKEGETNGEQ